MSNYVSLQTVAAAAYAYYTWDVNGAWGLLYAGASAYGDYQRGNTQIQGPKLSDLTIGSSQYGAAIPWGFGAPRLAGQIWWATDKQVISTTTGGKGGPEPEVTTYSYEMSMLIGLVDGPSVAISRIWSNGKLVWTRRAGASDETLSNSDGTNRWRRMSFYNGSDTQVPDHTYEAAVGVGNAPAYRGKSYVFIEGLQLGSSGLIPNMQFEVVISGTYSIGAVVAGPVATTVSNFNAGAAAASSSTTFRVHIGQWDNSYTTTAVRVYDVDLLDDAVTLVGAYNVSHPLTGASGAGTAGRGNTDTPVLVMASLTVIYSYSGLSGTQAVYTPPEFLGSGALRFARSGVHFVAGSSTTGSGRIYRFASTGGTPVASTAGTGYLSQSLVIIGDTVFAASTSGKVVWQFDLSTLALEATINRPSFGTPESDTDPYLFDMGGELGLIGRNISGDTRVYARRFGAWVDLGPISSTFVPQSNVCPSIGVVGGLLVGGFCSSPAGQYITWTAPLRVEPGVVSVSNIVDEVCRRAGMPEGTWDASELSSISRGVRAMGIAQILPARGILEQLAVAYFFTCTLSDKLRFVPRQTVPVVTIPWGDMGAGIDRAQDNPFELVHGSDLELPPQVAVTYANVDNDQQPGTEYSDRMVSGQASIAQMQFALGLTPAEAKGIADSLITDAVAGMLSASINVPIKYANVRCGDIVLPVAFDGRSYRMRVQRKREQRGVLTLDLVGDDATALVGDGLTDITQDIENDVNRYSDTALLALDMPLMRDADDVPGIYVAARGVSTPWPGCAVWYSADGIVYDRIATEVAESAVFGTATTALADYSGRGWDEINTVTVNVGSGTLASSTRDSMLADYTINALLLGDEVIRFRVATQVTPGVYTLSGLLRGRRGTEWAQGTHAIAERAALIRTRGLRRLQQQQNEVERTRNLKGVTYGASVPDAVAVVFTNTGVSQKPFSVGSLRGTLTTAGVLLAWKRRSRLQCTFGGAGGSFVPLGESEEAYDVELRDGSSNLVQSDRVTSPQWLIPGGSTVTTFERGLVAPHESGGSVYGINANGINGVQYLLQMTPAGALVTQSFALGDGPVQVAYDGATALVAAHSMSVVGGISVYVSSRLMRVDLSSLGAAAATWSPATAGELSGVAHDGTDVWTVSPTTTNNLRKHNASTLAVTATYTIGARPFAIRAAAGTLYVSLAGAGAQPGGVQAVNSSGTVLWTRDLELAVFDIEVVGSLVFAATYNGVAVLDASTGAIVAQYTDGSPTPYTAFSLALVGGNVVYRPIEVNATQRPFRVLDGASGAVLSEVPLPSVAAITGEVGGLAFGVNAAGSVGYTLNLTPNLAGYTATVYQISATVGRGYPSTITL